MYLLVIGLVVLVAIYRYRATLLSRLAEVALRLVATAAPSGDGSFAVQHLIHCVQIGYTLGRHRYQAHLPVQREWRDLIVEVEKEDGTTRLNLPPGTPPLLTARQLGGRTLRVVFADGSAHRLEADEYFLTRFPPPTPYKE